MTVVRKIIAVVAGATAASLVIAAVESVAHGSLAGDQLFAAVILGYGLGALAGTMVAAAVADPRTSIFIPVLLALLALINLFAFPHPLWFMPLAALALFYGWRLGTVVIERFWQTDAAGAS